MEINKRVNKIIIILILFGLLSSCLNNTKTIGIENKYKTEINIHYSTYHVETYTFYTNNKLDICSFNGTNYLIESVKNEELFSSTAPIEIVKQSKFDNNGKETECETNYYRGSN